MNHATVIVIAEVSMTETMSEGIYLAGQALCLGKVRGKLRDISIYGQDQWAWGAHLRRAERVRRVRLRRKQPNQSNARTRRFAVHSRGTGTTFAEISKKDFRPIPVILPQKEIMDAFTKEVSPLYDRIISNLKGSHTLATLRDTLLPKLLSGELRIVGEKSIKKHLNIEMDLVSIKKHLP